MIRVAPEGRPFIAAAALLAATSWLVAPVEVALVLSVVALWVLAFFRDPVRNGPRGDQLLLAPADGVVVSVLPVEEPDFVKERTNRISIFMNIFNVHVNRYPASGTVSYRQYHPGQFGHAGAEKASEANEQSSLGLVTARGRVLIRQIAGLVARRIVTDHEVGTQVIQGERLGIIRFGSRVDLYVPVAARVLAHTGQRTRAGITVVAQWD